MDLPILYKKDENNNIREIKIYTDGSYVMTEHGIQNGKKQVDKVFCEEKNIGKKNYKSSEQQAEFEANVKWKKKIDEGYVQNINKVDDFLFSVMKAEEYKENDTHFSFPCYAQHKFDGKRMYYLKDGLYSRMNKPIKFMEHIEKWLKYIYENYNVIPDGESYIPKTEFEETISATSRTVNKSEESEAVNFYWFDLIPIDTPKMVQFQRDILREKIYKEIKKIYPNENIPIVLVETFKNVEEKDLLELHDEAVFEGYEGLILRNPNGAYQNRRCHDLKKYKKFRDEEFIIIDIEEGKGRSKGTAIFICLTSEGKRFKAKPSCKVRQARKYFKKKEKYINKWLTVKFFGYTKYGIPRFPVAKEIREDWDL